MTAAAALSVWRGLRRRRAAIDPIWATLLLTCLGASSADAQPSIAASIFSDDRFRGYSLSDGRPVGILDLSYDDSSGLYGTVSGSVVASRDRGLRPLGLLLNAGYARRLPSGLTIDAGLTHSEYSTYSNRAAARSYSELYAGLSWKFLTGRLFVSPDYQEHGSLYGEVDAGVDVAPKLRLSGHAGMLVPFRRSDYGDAYSRDFDWRIGLTRQFGATSAQLAWTGVRPGHDAYRSGYHHRQAIVAGLAFSL